MLWLKRVIARLLGAQTLLEPTPVSPTQTAGPVLPEPTLQAGNKTSAQATKPQRQSRRQSPVPAASQKKQKSASQTTPVSKGSSKKQKPAPMAQSRNSAGNSIPTPASGTRPHAKRQPKRKP